MAARLSREETLPIPGMEPVRNEKVHRSAKRYAKLRDARMAANEGEKAAHNNLLTLMIAEGLTSYRYGDVEIFVDSTQKCKVKVGGDDSKKKGEDDGAE